MAEDCRVVAHFRGGTLLKGTALDFMPNRPSFQLRPQDGKPPVEVVLGRLKALFFVKDLKGRPDRRNLRGFMHSPGTTPQGKKVIVRFKDGEVLCGYSHTYERDREGFFLFPADTGSNNLRIYVILAATSDVKVGPAADVFARTMLRPRSA